MAHGCFESSDEAPECPEGCDTVERVFLTPVGFASARTKAIDATLESVARSHGLTDMNNRGGRAAAGPNTIAQQMAQEKMRQQQEAIAAAVKAKFGDAPWNTVPEGGTYNVKTGEVEAGQGPGAPGALPNVGWEPSNLAHDAKEAGLLTPKPVLVRKDHENLSIDMVKA